MCCNLNEKKRCVFRFSNVEKKKVNEYIYITINYHKFFFFFFYVIRRDNEDRANRFAFTSHRVSQLSRWDPRIKKLLDDRIRITSTRNKVYMYNYKYLYIIPVFHS